MTSLPRLLLIMITLLLPAVAAASEATPAAVDAALEKRVNALAEELRCLVCQNQSIADSHAGLAVDLKNQIRDKLRDGASESEIRDFMVARYGDFVLYRPPVRFATVFLWFGPPLLLALGLWWLFRTLARKRSGDSALSEPEQARARELLARNPEGDRQS